MKRKKVPLPVIVCLFLGMLLILGGGVGRMLNMVGIGALLGVIIPLGWYGYTDLKNWWNKWKKNKKQ